MKNLITLFLIAISVTLFSQNTTVYLPTVVHVVWNNSSQNILDAKVLAQITQLNDDYGRTNSDAINTPAIWQSIAADTKIQFCLAQRDPNGNPTTGIVHKQTSVLSFSSNDVVKLTAQGGDDAWDVTRYFNIWICNLGSGLLGYGQFPPVTSTYGVVVQYCTVGSLTSPGTCFPYAYGRTLTAETGHCFNLKHLFADPNCIDTDGVTDTPTTSTSPTGCDSFPQPNTCTGGDMSMNFMVPVVDELCKNLFTLGQKTRMWNMINANLTSLLEVV